MTSRIYKKLVVAWKLASSAGGDYSGSGLDGGTISLYAVAADGVPLTKVEAAIDEVLADIAQERRHRRGTGSCEEQLSCRLHLRKRQPGDARPPLWMEPWRSAVLSPMLKRWPEALLKVTADDEKGCGEVFRLTGVCYWLSHSRPNGRGPKAKRPASSLLDQRIEVTVDAKILFSSVHERRLMSPAD